MSHIQWAFWTFLMMPYEKIDTDQGVEDCLAFYMEYGYARIQLYFKALPVLFPEIQTRLHPKL